MSESRPFVPRALAPAAGFPAIHVLLAALLRKGFSNSAPWASTLHVELQRLFLGREPEHTGSGKEALYTLFSRNRQVESVTSAVIAGYTCPDVVAAAIRAECKIELVDVDVRTLEPSFSTLQAERPVALLSNLYGLIDSSPTDGLPFIDDACQAAMSSIGGIRIGCRGQWGGVLSFGRGKAICGIGGGAALLPEASRPSQASTCATLVEEVSALSRVFVSAVLQHPRLYWIPNSMPMLKLGETHFEPTFPLRPRSAVEALEALCFLARLPDVAKQLRDAAGRWSRVLPSQDLVQPWLERGRGADSADSVPIRYPVLFPTPSARDQVYAKLREAGLGASLSYPAPVSEFLKQKNVKFCGNTPNAADVAARILTLPVHRYVTEPDVMRTSEIIRAAL